MVVPPRMYIGEHVVCILRCRIVWPVAKYICVGTEREREREREIYIYYTSDWSAMSAKSMCLCSIAVTFPARPLRFP